MSLVCIYKSNSSQREYLSAENNECMTTRHATNKTDRSRKQKNPAKKTWKEKQKKKEQTNKQ